MVCLDGGRCVCLCLFGGRELRPSKSTVRGCNGSDKKRQRQKAKARSQTHHKLCRHALRRHERRCAPRHGERRRERVIEAHGGAKVGDLDGAKGVAFGMRERRCVCVCVWVGGWGWG